MKKIIILAFILFLLNLTNKSLEACEICTHKVCLTNHILANPDKKDEILRALEFSPDGKPLYEQSQVSPNGLFKIFYHVTGVHKVENKDVNNNGIPDFVDMVAYYFEDSYNYYVEQNGWLDPIERDTQGNIIPYQVYLWDLGDTGIPGDDDYDEYPTYGLTSAESSSDSGNFQKYTSYIIIDNDFSTKDSVRSQNPLDRTRPTFFTTGEDALKATAAHEFLHAIQLKYGYDNASFSILSEMYSTSFENIVYNDSKDFVQYLHSLLRRTDSFAMGVNDANNGYRFATFGHLVDRLYGSDVLRRKWELVGDKVNGFIALDSALKEVGSSMEIAWGLYIQWLYLSGPRAAMVDEDERFRFAELFPDITFYTEEFYSSPSLQVSGELRPYEFRALRFYIKGTDNKSNDTIDIVLGNFDLNTARSQSGVKMPYHITISETYQPGMIELPDIPYYVSLNYPNGNITESIYVFRGDQTRFITAAYPNPYNPFEEPYLYFPVPEVAKLGEKVILNIYNSQMHRIMETELVVGVDYNNRAVRFQNSDLLKSGNYIFTLEHKEKVTMGKFAVILGK